MVAHVSVFSTYVLKQENAPRITPSAWRGQYWSSEWHLARLWLRKSVCEIVKRAHTFTCTSVFRRAWSKTRKLSVLLTVIGGRTRVEKHWVGQVWTQHRPGWTQTTQTLTGTLSWWICSIKTRQEKHKRGRIVFHCCRFLCTCLLLSKNSSCIDRLSFPVCIREYGRMKVHATIERQILDTPYRQRSRGMSERKGEPMDHPVRTRGETRVEDRQESEWKRWWEEEGDTKTAENVLKKREESEKEKKREMRVALITPLLNY